MTEPLPHEPQDHLPRLGPGAYRGRAIVHWTLTVNQRSKGWLNDGFHASFRWLLLHGCARNAAACPAYCLMPDHAHLLIVGWTRDSDQSLFMPWFRKHTNLLLKPTNDAWQKQAYDHVLRPQETDRYAFQTLTKYITENPVRAGLARSAREWPYTGSIIPGYPELDFWADDYWPRYWHIVASRVGK